MKRKKVNRMRYCFGVDVGGTTVKLGLFSEEGQLIVKWEIKTRTEEEGKHILPDIQKTLQEKMEEHKIPKENVLGIGIGIPAPVGEEGIVRNTANLGWGYKEVKKELEDFTGQQVAVGNDANLAALGEMWQGAGKGQRNMIMVTLGTGVGGGIIVGGMPLVGACGAGGEIGHIRVNRTEKKPCGCGKCGCLEQYASARGIARLAEEHLRKSKEPSILRRRKNNSAKSVFDAYQSGDKLAETILEEFGEYLGEALANLSVALDPSVIVIGGGVSKAGTDVLRFIEKYYRRYQFFANAHTRFELAKLGNDAGICGAAKLVLEKQKVNIQGMKKESF